MVEDLADLEEMLTTVDTAITTMTNAATSLGAIKSRIDVQKDFAKNLMDAIDTGVGQLVDADMNEDRPACRLCRCVSSLVCRLSELPISLLR